MFRPRCISNGTSQPTKPLGIASSRDSPCRTRRTSRLVLTTACIYVYQVRRPQIDPPYIDAVVETFEAVWGWTASDENLDFWDYLAGCCKQSGTLYTQTVYPDYYTSKVYPQGDTTHTILSTAEDRIELVTLLTAPADCYLNDHALGTAPAGLTVHSLPTEPGPVRVRILRNGHEILTINPPQPAVKNPHRTDRLTYSYSSAFDVELATLFPSD